MLLRKPMIVDVSGIPVKVPHPADYCLHKLFIYDRRKLPDKRKKDLESALAVLEALKEKEGWKTLNEAFQDLTDKEKKRVLAALRENGYEAEKLLTTPSPQ